MKFSRQLTEAVLVGKAGWGRNKDIPIYQMDLAEVKERSERIPTGDYIKGIALHNGEFLVFGEMNLEHETVAGTIEYDGKFAFYLFRRIACGAEWIISVDTPSNRLAEWNVVDPLPDDHWSFGFERMIIKTFPFAEWIEFNSMLVRVNPKRRLEHGDFTASTKDYEKLMGQG